MVSTPPNVRQVLPVTVEAQSGPQPFYILLPSVITSYSIHYTKLYE